MEPRHCKSRSFSQSHDWPPSIGAEADSDISFEPILGQTPMSCLDNLADRGTLLLHSFGWAAAIARLVG
jgi:hypothetical protein